jgi:DNA-binding NarL/FixJ family response regulator
MLLILERPAGTPDDPLATLSDQERRVFTLLRQGLTTKEIARDLEIASNTVSTFKARSMQKLGATSPIDLFRFGEGREGGS